LFCVKRVLEAAGLIVKEGSLWHLQEDVASIAAGESFTSLEACAKAMVASLQRQYGRGRKAAA
jgi:hypothetical protein